MSRSSTDKSRRCLSLHASDVSIYERRTTRPPTVYSPRCSSPNTWHRELSLATVLRGWPYGCPPLGILSESPYVASVNSSSREKLIEHDVPADYIHSDVFRNPNPLQTKITVPGTQKSSAQIPEGVTHPKTFLKVARFVAQTAANEIKHGTNPLFTSWRERGGKAFQAAMLRQFTAYALGYFPFNRPVGEGQAISSWWEELRGSENASLLAVREHYYIG